MSDRHRGRDLTVSPNDIIARYAVWFEVRINVRPGAAADRAEREYKRCLEMIPRIKDADAGQMAWMLSVVEDLIEAYVPDDHPGSAIITAVRENLARTAAEMLAAE